MKEILIVGSARCVWDDVAGLPEFSNVMCVNDIGMHWPGPVRHWYSNDVEMLVKWAAARRQEYIRLFGGPGQLHSGTKREGFENVKFWGYPGQGGSGLWAITCALDLGYDNITVAGMPFDDDGHYYNPPQTHTLKRDRLWSRFSNETTDLMLKAHANRLKNFNVNVISGRLRKYLEQCR